MKAVLLLLLLSLSCAVAENVVTVYNYSGVAVSIDNNGLQYDVPNGGVIYFSIEPGAFMTAVPYGQNVSYDLDWSIGPVATIGLNSVGFSGRWDHREALAAGLGLAAVVFGYQFAVWLLGKGIGRGALLED